MKILQAMKGTLLVLTAASAIVTVMVLPFVTWDMYGLSFQFIGATIFFVFVLLVALTSW